jgi:O-antigen ligase
VGVGDANDALYQAYADNGLSGALHYHLNAHNQYLQTFLGLGLFGLLLLFEFTWVQMIRAIRRKYFLMFVFAFLIALNFLVESMLQTAAGVLFFMYFYAILSTHSHKELSHA